MISPKYQGEIGLQPPGEHREDYAWTPWGSLVSPFLLPDPIVKVKEKLQLNPENLDSSRMKLWSPDLGNTNEQTSQLRC